MWKIIIECCHLNWHMTIMNTALQPFKTISNKCGSELIGMVEFLRSTVETMDIN